MTTEVKIVRDWDANTFHQRVLQLELAGYTSRLETYTVTPEMNPDTGEVTHLHSIELVRTKGGQGAESGGKLGAS